MKRLPDGVSARSFSIQTNSSLKKITIRNGFLWGKNENNRLVYVNLNNRNSLIVKELTDIGEIDFFSVSPNGEMCYAKTKSNEPLNYLYYSSDLSRRQLKLLPDCVAKSATWMHFINKAKPYLFLYVEAPNKKSNIQLLYFNFNQTLAFCSPVTIIPPIPGQVIAFSIFQFDNKNIGGSFIIYNKTNSSIDKGPYQLYIAPLFETDSFLPIESNEKPLPLSDFTMNSKFFIENQYISTPQKFYLILLDPSKEASSKINHEEIKLLVDPKANYLFVFNNIIFQFVNQNLSLFLISKNKNEEPIDCIQLYDDPIFELDTYSSNLYSISQDNVITSYQFSSSIPATGFDSFLFWIYFRLIKEQTKLSISSAAIILLQTSASFDQKFNLARKQSDSFRLEVFKELLESVKPTHPVQRTVIASLALDIYVRKETSDKNENEKDTKMKEFIQWAKHLISKKILTQSIIEKTLIQYNWNEALAVFLQPQAAFELNMQLGQYEEARKQLKQIQQPEDFGYSALRLHSLIPGDAVYKDVKERDDALTNGTLIPLMNNEYYIDHLKQLFASSRLTTSWLRSLFCLYMAKFPDSLSINQYFKNYSLDTEIMIRSLLSAKRYSEAAHGICSLENNLDLLPMAVSIYSKVSPQEAFELIPEDAPLPLKRRCALKILRSLTREKAEVVAQKSLLNSISGIDAATLIEYMPQTTTVGKMSKAIKRYANRNLIIESEEKKKSEEALEGIRNSNKLVEQKEAQVTKLYKFSICYRCGRPLLNGPAVVYPCSHAFHIQCALELFNDYLFVNPNISSDNDNNNNYISNNNINYSSASFDLSNNNPKLDLNADCPLCGFMCIKKISEPFEPDRDSSKDEWETDQFTLSKLLK